MKFWNNPKIVTCSPIVTTCLIESANVGQMVHMWTYHTAAGQSLWSWILVNIALWIWGNFYRVIMPEESIARLSIRAGIVLNMGVILSVIYWRYI